MEIQGVSRQEKGSKIVLVSTSIVLSTTWVASFLTND